MKSLICFLLPVIFLVSCKHELQQVNTYYDIENKELRESFTVRPDSPAIREGVYMLYGKDGKPVEKRNYRHNQIQDTLIKYYPSGKVSEKTLFVNGQQNGERRVYFESGALMIVEHYAEDQFEGPYASFYENGQQKEEGMYVKNVMDGKWKYYYDTGEVKEVVTFANNEENGEYQSFYKSGKVKAAGAYSHGIKSGSWKSYDEEGKMISEENFDSM